MKTAAEKTSIEEIFDLMMPEEIMLKSDQFFTPANIAIQASKWLSGKDKRKILDIGAGVGKFCLFGALNTRSTYFGIEMRPRLVKIAEEMFRTFSVRNAKVVQGNILDFQFKEFDAFYLYNPFYENLAPDMRMDDSILLSDDFYSIYLRHTRSQLALARTGTRLVTYHGLNLEVPTSYRKVEEFNTGNLKYWVKEK